MDYLTQSKNQVIYDFIKQHPGAVLATIGGDGAINMANVLTAVDERFRLYAISRPGNRKITNINTHPSVTLMFTDALSATQVEYIGTAEVLEAQHDVSSALTMLHEVTSDAAAPYWVPPVSQLEDSGYVVIRVTPEHIVHRSYSRPGIGREHEETQAVLG